MVNYLGKKNVKSHQLDLVTVCCLFAASKKEEIVPLSLSLAKSMLFYKYSQSQICATEVSIMTALKFKLNYTTFDDYMNIIMYRWDCYLKNDNSYLAQEFQE